MSAPARSRTSSLRLYDAGLRAVTAGTAPEVQICDDRGRCRPLPLTDWCAEQLPGDRALLGLCTGTTLDVGCGPGRLTAALTTRSRIALGIDVSAAAVELTRARGGNAVRTSVFGWVPAAASWDTVLLADGNIGIGGDPTALLRRVCALMAPGGRVVVELDPTSTTAVERLQLRRDTDHSEFFPWALVGHDAIAGLADAAGLHCRNLAVEEGRWFAVLAS